MAATVCDPMWRATYPHSAAVRPSAAGGKVSPAASATSAAGPPPRRQMPLAGTRSPVWNVRRANNSSRDGNGRWAAVIRSLSVAASASRRAM